MVRFARARRRLTTTLAGALPLLFTGQASAFERQWHVGGGLGLASESETFGTGFALGLHGAYGISDVFDARLELQGSRHDVGGIPVSLYFTRAGLAYKLDVLQWIPYLGGSAGAFSLVWDEGASVRPCAGGFFGLDYAISRHAGVGFFLAFDYVFANPALLVGTGLVRGEYRFGW